MIKDLFKIIKDLLKAVMFISYPRISLAKWLVNTRVNK